MRRFTAVLCLLALFAVFATPVFADEPAAAAPDTDAVAQPAEQAPAAPQVSEENAEDFLKSLEGTAGAEDKYVCPGYLKCTYTLECERFWGFELNCQNGTQPICDNPTGYACAGTCICC
jgi:hypothetical protein